MRIEIIGSYALMLNRANKRWDIEHWLFDNYRIEAYRRANVWKRPLAAPGYTNRKSAKANMLAMLNINKITKLSIMDGFQAQHLFSSFQVFKARKAGMQSARFDYSRKFRSARCFVDNLYPDFSPIFFPQVQNFFTCAIIGGYTTQSTREWESWNEKHGTWKIWQNSLRCDSGEYLLNQKSITRIRRADFGVE